MVCTCGFNQDKTLLQTTHPYIMVTCLHVDTAGMTQDCVIYIYLDVDFGNSTRKHGCITLLLY